VQAVPHMALQPPVEPEELRDWFRDLKAKSGLSYAAIAAEIGDEERNVKRWMTAGGKPTIPSGDVVLRLLTVLGVQMTPAPPLSVAPVHLRLQEIDGSLTHVLEQVRGSVMEPSLERRLEEVSVLAAEGLARVEAGIARVEARLAGEEPQDPGEPKENSR
jgi:hypothetical protein